MSKIDKKTRKNKYTLTKNIVNAMLYTTKNTTDLILKNYTESKNRKIKEETTMKAMYIDAPGQVSIKDVEMPVRKEGEVLLKILYGGICGKRNLKTGFNFLDNPAITPPLSAIRISPIQKDITPVIVMQSVTASFAESSTAPVTAGIVPWNAENMTPDKIINAHK